MDHPGCLHSIESGHVDVQQDEVWLQLWQKPDRLLAGRSRADQAEPACGRHDRGGRTTEVGAVVNDEHTGLSWPLLRSPSRLPCLPLQGLRLQAQPVRYPPSLSRPHEDMSGDEDEFVTRDLLVEDLSQHPDSLLAPAALAEEVPPFRIEGLALREHRADLDVDEPNAQCSLLCGGRIHQAAVLLT